MKKAFISIFCICIAVSSLADQGYKSVSDKKEQKNYSYDIQYPVLDKAVVPGYEKINARILDEVNSNSCDVNEAENAGYQFDYQNVVRILSLNKNFVSYEFSGSADCGGAHPSHFLYNLTFNSQTGDVLDFAKEVPSQDYASKDYHDFRVKIAEILVKKYKDLVSEQIAGCNEMYEGQEGMIGFLSCTSPTISGLTDNKIIVSTQPPHALFACGVRVEVEFKDVATLFSDTSIVREWFDK